jgi:adenosylcobyric acid synthase
VLNGKPAGNFSAAEYFLSGNRSALFEEVKQSYHRLASRHTPIVMEGAGSISELNLKHLDITNMRMAMAAGAATWLIADIDKGGVFGSCYGTIALLDEAERSCIKGIIINKFRGDLRLFDDGRAMLEKICGVPVLGVVPYFRDIHIEEEDAIGRHRMDRRFLPGKVNIAVILLPRLSNFTDFHYLEQDPRVNLFYTHDAAELEKADIIILPGSKNTIEDLLALREAGIDIAIQRAFEKQKTVIGICGGYQMMGLHIDDPDQVESKQGSIAGLGLLPVSSTMKEQKTTLQRKFTFQHDNTLCEGYEIHMGVTTSLREYRPLTKFPDGGVDGYFLTDRCWGTYLHGILDNPSVVDSLVAPYTDAPGNALNYRRHRDEQYDKLAALLRQHLDIPSVYKILEQAS